MALVLRQSPDIRGVTAAMARQEREYRQLPGRGRKRGGFITITRIRARLWAGKDHLLCLFSTGYTEEYKRFYYRDIQAIVMRKTGRGAAGNIFSALFLLLFAAFAMTATTPAGAAVLWIVTGLAALVLVVNLLRGPTCICHLQTAVSREELPSLSRERNAKKALDILKPLIEGAQGILTREEMVTRSAELSRQQESEVRSPSGERSGPAVPGYRGKVHEALFYLLLMDGVLNAAHFFVHGPVLGVIGSLCWVAVSIMVIVALVKQQGGLTGGLRSITWGAFAYMAVTFLLGYVLVIYETIKNPDAMMAMGNSQWALFMMFSNLSPADNPVLMFGAVLSTACALPLGFMGLVLLQKFRREQRPGAAVQRLSAGSTALPGRTEQ